MRRLALLPTWAWLVLFVAAPFAILLAISVAAADEGVPPLAWPLGWEEGGPVWRGSGDNFALLATDPFYRAALWRSLRVAATTGALCLLLAYPMALGIARAPARWRTALLLAVLLPFWTGFLLRVGAWIGLLRDGGWVNGWLQALGMTSAPVRLLYTELSMDLGLVHAYLPFAVLPLVATLTRLDPALAEAAADLGARPFTVFRTVTLPLSLPGAAAGFLLVFIPVAGEFVIPELLGPPDALLLGRALWGEFFTSRDWPLASALAVVLLGLLLLPIRLFQRLGEAPR